MAGRFFRKLTKRFFVFITIILSCLFILSCLVAYLNPIHWWPISFLGLALPYVIVVLIFAIIFWLILKPKYSLIPFIALTIGYFQIRALFAFHIKHSFNSQKDSNDIRIITWNVRNFVALSKNEEKQKLARQEIVEAVLKRNADIVCLQEFNHSATRPEADNIALFTSAYPYYYYSKDVSKKNGFYEYGSIIFSKFPIINKARIPYTGINKESLIYTDIIKNTDTIRVFTSHLQSFKFSQHDYADLQKIKQQEDENLAASKNIVKKMKLAFTKRGLQAHLVREQLDKSPHPTIICGDFNDVPNSYTYFKIRGEYNDAFLEKSFGIGRTFIALAPTLRIDYILTHPDFKIQQFERIDEGLSDHTMLISDVSLRK